MKWIYLITFLIIVIVFIRVKKRGFFWRDKVGNKLSLKEFGKRFLRGVEGITPLQSVKTTLWSFIPIFGGLVWGIVITLMGGTYWLSLILMGSLPITIIQFIGNFQKYKSLRKVEELMKEVNGKKR